jgi:hypothetical protein
MLTYRFSLHCVPESDRPVGSSRDDFGALCRPRDGSNFLLSHQGGIEFGQFFPAGLVEVEDVDFSVIVAASEEVVSGGIEVHASNGAALVVPEGGQQLGFFCLSGGTPTCEMS